MSSENILEVSHLKQYFPVKNGFRTVPLKAVDDISFTIKPGETLGLVGEFYVFTSQQADVLYLMAMFFMIARKKLM